MGNVTRNWILFYQLGNDYLTATLFNGTSGSPSLLETHEFSTKRFPACQWETRESSRIGLIAANTSIASLNGGYTPVSVTMNEVVISTGSSGTAINPWNGQTQTFATREYSTVLGESTSSATNEDAHVYGLQNGTVREFKVDNILLVWTSIGSVVTN